MFRYFMWLPERNYEGGYDCDLCSKDFIRGPLFHCSHSGKDYCIPCGESVGLDRYYGLVSSLHFPSSLFVDGKTNAIVLFKYTLSAAFHGVLFSDGTSITYSVGDGHIAEVFANGEKIGSVECRSRFPWLIDLSTSAHTIISLHPESKGEKYPTHLFVCSFRAGSTKLELELCDGVKQVFDCDLGEEFVAEDGELISIFQYGDLQQRQKRVAQSQYKKTMTLWQ